MIEIQGLSAEYHVRKIQDGDIEDVYQLCIGNPLYYEYCPPVTTRKGIEEDLVAVPPNTKLENKYFVGFYRGEDLIAVMDLIDGYPKNGIAFIGLFMMDQSIQGKGVGTAIIEKVCEYLKQQKFVSVRLGWVKGNPQAEHFWTKNHFMMIKESSSNVGQTVILAERTL